MGRLKGVQSTVESWMMANGKPGETFYSDKPDKSMTAIAAAYSRKIKTERLIAVTTKKTEVQAKYITKVTLL